MTYKEAREAAAQALTQTFDAGRGLTDPPALSEMREENRALAFSCIDAALSAFSAAGYTLIETVPSDKTLDAMINAQIDAEQTFDDLVGPMEAAHRALITAALKERQA